MPYIMVNCTSAAIISGRDKWYCYRTSASNTLNRMCRQVLINCIPVPTVPVSRPIKTP